MTESTATRSIRQAYDVPDGIHLLSAGREVLAWRPGYDASVRVVAARPDRLPVSVHGGRHPLRRLAHPHGRLLVRESRKGGLLRHLRGRTMHGPWRPLAELVLHRRLEVLGVPVAPAVGAVILRRKPGWRGFFLVEEVAGARDLEAILHGQPVPGGGERHALYRAAGRAVRHLHDAGVPHPDLHPKNLLATPGGAVLLLDLDKAQPEEGPLPESARLKNLLRLGRAIAKHHLKGMEVEPEDGLQFLEGYAGSREAAVLWLGQLESRLRRGLGVRHLWWRVIGEARPWRAPALPDVPALPDLPDVPDEGDERDGVS